MFYTCWWFFISEYFKKDPNISTLGIFWGQRRDTFAPTTKYHRGQAPTFPPPQSRHFIQYYDFSYDYSTLTVFTTAFGIWYLCAAADRHNDPMTLRETTSALVVPPITRALARHHAHYRRRPPGAVFFRRRSFRWWTTESPCSSARQNAERSLRHQILEYARRTTPRDSRFFFFIFLSTADIKRREPHTPRARMLPIFRVTDFLLYFIFDTRDSEISIRKRATQCGDAFTRSYRCV